MGFFGIFVGATVGFIAGVSINPQTAEQIRAKVIRPVTEEFSKIEWKKIADSISPSSSSKDGTDGGKKP